MESYQKLFIIRIIIILAMVIVGAYFSLTHNFLWWAVIFGMQIAHLFLIITEIDAQILKKFLD